MPPAFTRRDTWTPGGYRPPVRPVSNKILVVLPFWNGDKRQHMALARLIADLEEKHSEVADILFLARFDTDPDLKTIEYVSRKFNVHVYKSKRREVGWPHGCNGLFAGCVEFFIGNDKFGKIPRYKAMLIVEADCVPLSKTWLAELSQMWDQVNRERPVYIAGAYIPASATDGSRDHINGGCCFISCDLTFLQWLNQRLGRLNVGWDWQLATQFQTKGWADIPAIWSHWHCKDKTEEEVRGIIQSGVLLFHGCKGPNMLDNARTILL